MLVFETNWNLRGQAGEGPGHQYVFIRHPYISTPTVMKQTFSGSVFSSLALNPGYGSLSNGYTGSGYPGYNQVRSQPWHEIMLRLSPRGHRRVTDVWRPTPAWAWRGCQPPSPVWGSAPTRSQTRCPWPATGCRVSPAAQPSPAQTAR